MILQMRYYGDPVLREKAKPVKEVTDEIRTLAKDMLETMYAERGIGLAATQVGIVKRMLAVDTQDETKNPMVLLNPVIERKSDEEIIMEEGCLSFPGIYGKVKRAAEIWLKGKTLEGKEEKFHLTELECRVVLHEMDHLDGVLFIDRMPASHRLVIAPDLKKLSKKTKELLQTA